MRIAVAGSTGLIGSALIPVLRAEGHEVVPLIRPDTTAVAAGIPWDPVAGSIDAAALEGCDAVVNLAGRSIGERRWTEAEKAVIRSSRVDATALLAATIAGMDRKPEVLVNASAYGIYGDRGDEWITEDAPAGEGFFPEVCAAWEAATAAASQAGVRVVHLRTGIVLGPEGGALGRMLAPFGPAWLSPYRWGLGGWIGSGRQYWSWISLDDEVRAIRHLLGSDLSGPVNLTSPEPVRNKAFVKAVGRALRRPVLLPIPRFVLNVVLGSELAQASLFESTAALPERLLGDGFGFRNTDLDEALSIALSA
jgi:uncharacterized protein (TIGR01777 family)